jgi:hypothetical protein
MGSLIFILAPVLGAICLATGFVIALGVVAARADEHFDRQLAEEGGEAVSEILDDTPIAVPTRDPASAPALAGSYAGLARAHATIAPEPSMAVPSSSTSVGTMRFPVKRSTSRRPRVRLKMPGRTPRP